MLLGLALAENEQKIDHSSSSSSSSSSRVESMDQLITSKGKIAAMYTKQSMRFSSISAMKTWPYFFFLVGCTYLFSL